MLLVAALANLLLTGETCTPGNAYPLVYALQDGRVRAKTILALGDGSNDLISGGEVYAPTGNVSNIEMNYYRYKRGYYTIFVNRLSDDGTVIWSTLLQNPGQNLFFIDMELTASNNVYVVGYDDNHYDFPLIGKVLSNGAVGVTYMFDRVQSMALTQSYDMISLAVLSDTEVVLKMRGTKAYGSSLDCHPSYSCDSIALFKIDTSTHTVTKAVSIREPGTYYVFYSYFDIKVHSGNLYMLWSSDIGLDYAGLLRIDTALTTSLAKKHNVDAGGVGAYNVGMDFGTSNGFYLTQWDDYAASSVHNYLVKFRLSDLQCLNYMYIRTQASTTTVPVSSIGDMKVLNDTYIYFSLQEVESSYWYSNGCRVVYGSPNTIACFRFTTSSDYQTNYHASVAIRGSTVYWQAYFIRGYNTDTSTYDTMIFKSDLNLDFSSYHRVSVTSESRISLNDSITEQTQPQSTAVTVLIHTDFTVRQGRIQGIVNKNYRVIKPYMMYTESVPSRTSTYVPGEKPYTPNITLLNTDAPQNYTLNLKYAQCPHNHYFLYPFSSSQYIDFIIMHPDTGQFEVNPQVSWLTGTYEFQLLQEMTSNATGFFNITITDAAPNFVDLTSSISCSVQFACQVTANATDPQNDTILATVIDQYGDTPAGLTVTVLVNGTINIDWTPSVGQETGGNPGQDYKLYNLSLGIYQTGREDAQRRSNFTITVQPNRPPEFDTSVPLYKPYECQNNGQFKLPNITEQENETYTVASTTMMDGSPFPSFITFNPTLVSYFYSPLPGDGLAAPGKDYEQKLTMTDASGNAKEYNITVKVHDSAPIWGTQSTTSIQVPATINVPIQSSYLNNWYDGKVVGADGVTDVDWLKYDNNTMTVVEVDPVTQDPVPISLNAREGTYNFKLLLINLPCTTPAANSTAPNNFAIQIVRNQIPQVISGTTTSYTTVQGHPHNFTIQNPQFTDTENAIVNLTLGHVFVSGNQSLAPVLLQLHTGDTIVEFHPHALYSGMIILAYTALDDNNQTGTLSIQVNVQPCSLGCTSCSGVLYYECLTCEIGYYFHQNQCMNKCPIGMYGENGTQLCQPCHSDCYECEGPDPLNNCTSCIQSPMRFYLNNGCYEICPLDFYEDYISGKCKSCFTPCTKCVGSNYYECTQCNATMLYLKATTSECMKLTCAVEYVFINAATVTCDPCMAHCKLCQDGTSCEKCVEEYVYVGGQCVHCNTITGKYLNEDKYCVPKCGDGFKIELEQCDDNNTVVGDGCDQYCQEEAGFNCSSGVCIENVKPKFKPVKVTDTNIIQYEFTENVFNKDNTTFDKSKFVASIVGSNAPYIYEWDFIASEKAYISGKDGKLKKFNVAITNIQSVLIGGGREKFKLRFLNASDIRDLIGNVMDSEDVLADLSPFNYQPPGATDLAEGSGATMRAGLILLILVQIMMNFALDSSAALMWSITHLMQVFNFLLLLNLDMHEILVTMGKYFRIASGDFPDIELKIPTFWSFRFFIEEDVQADYIKMQEKFDAADIDSPFIAIEYRAKFSVALVIVFIIVPLIYLGSFKMYVFKQILATLFWNTPIRTMVELYLEFVFLSILNLPFLQYQNRSSFYASSVCIFSMTFSLMFPFIIFAVITHYQGKHHTKWYKSKFGALHDEFKITNEFNSSIYYVLFLFQRMSFAYILVYLYDFPLIQCGGVILICILMIYYIVHIRPFKEESQQFLAASDEAATIFIVITLMVYSLNLSDQRRLALAFVVIGIFAGVLMKSFIIFMQNTVVQVRGSMKATCEKDETKEALDDQILLEQNPKLLQQVRERIEQQKKVQLDQSQFMEQVTYIQPIETVRDYSLPNQNNPSVGSQKTIAGINSPTPSPVKYRAPKNDLVDSDQFLQEQDKRLQEMQRKKDEIQAKMQKVRERRQVLKGMGKL